MMASDKAIHSHATDHEKQTPSNVKPEGTLEKNNYDRVYEKAATSENTNPEKI